MMTQSRLHSLISSDDAAFIQQGVSICVASRDVRHVPSLSRALACRIDGEQLHLVLSRSQCVALVRDIEKSREIAVVFTQPSTHRTLQIKGHDAKVLPANPDDIELTRQAEAGFALDLEKIGFGHAFVRRMFACDNEDLCVVRFTPSDVFVQTPGPNAGNRLSSLS